MHEELIAKCQADIDSCGSPLPCEGCSTIEEIIAALRQDAETIANLRKAIEDFVNASMDSDDYFTAFDNLKDALA